MNFILVSLSLFAIFLLISVIYDIADIADPAHYDPYSQQPLSPIAEFCLSEWAVSVFEYKALAQPQVVLVQRSSNPFRLQLYWDSSMSEPSAHTHADSTKDSESAAVPRLMKRFSIQLPLASSSSLDASSSEVELQRCSSPEEEIEKPDSGTFLVALAAQERRVLELKEELHKAESDLTKLKRQWAHHEVLKKKQETRQAQPMRSIKSPTQSALLSQESKRKGELVIRRSVATRTKQTQRKVFEGGRHTRTLSLLSPTSMANRGSIDMSAEKSGVGPGPRTAVPIISTPMHTKQQSLDLPKEHIVNTGKQIMDDLKEGLWTFIEDLKQATVGEEALSPSRIRHGVSLTEVGNKAAATSASRENSMIVNRPSSAEKTAIIFKQLAVNSAHPVMPSAPTSPEETASKVENATSSAAFKTTSDDGDDDEVWDNWDSPPSKNGGSNYSSTGRSTPRSSVSSDSKELNSSLDTIPWPALQKLTPGNLTRTASTLMREWEKSLISPQEELSGPR